MEPRAAQPHHDDNYPSSEHPQRIPVTRFRRNAASPVVHVFKTAIMLAPLVASEFIKDPSRTWKWSRIALGAATILDQVDYAIKCHKDNERERPQEQSWVDRSRPSEHREYQR
jgi:hypothetical protein